MKTFGIIFKHIASGVMARETGVDSITWLVIEAYHLRDTQRQLNVLTIPSFIITSLDWEEIHIPYKDYKYKSYCEEAIKINSRIFQNNPDLYFLNNKL